MNSLIARFGLAAAALCGVLAGCNAVEDVREDPFITNPPQTVALNGVIHGLGNRRVIWLMNNGDAAGAVSFLAPTQTRQTESITPFTFGPVAVGSPYKIQVRDQPYGKNCVVSGNSEGTITTQDALNIRVDCTNITSTTDPRYVPRYAVRVQVPDAFIGSANAKVSLATEDGLFEKLVPDAAATVACGANKCVEFPSAVVSVPTVCTPAITNGAACAANTLVSAVLPAGVAFRYSQNAYPYAVTASNTELGVLNKCRVTNPTNATAPTLTLSRPTLAATQPEVIIIPTADVTNVVVGSCDFTISGTVSYNNLSGGAVPAMGAGGLTLGLRNAAGKMLPGITSDLNLTSFGAFTLTTVAKSNQQNGLLDVVITRHPDGQFCIFDTSINLNLYVPGTTANPVDKTISVQCRALPQTTGGSSGVLKGVYRLTSSTYQANTASAVVGPVLWNPFSQTQQNIASSNIISFFDDGTFLYGTHGVTTTQILVQVEHGFYDFNAGTGVLRFALVTDTNPRTVLSPNGTTATATTAFANILNRTATPGLSATPGFSTTTKTTTMSNVTFGTAPPPPVNNTVDPPVHTIKGSFGTLGATTAKLDWELSEPVSRSGEWTGTWVTQDHRRFVVWDFNTLYVMHVGVAGGTANMQDVCLATDDVHASFGRYIRRATATGCYPVNRIFPGQTGYVITSFEAPDAPVSAANQSPLRTPEVSTTPLTEIPGWVGRIPGGAPQFDLRSPSPMYFMVRNSSEMAANNRQDLFPTPAAGNIPYTTGAPFPSWCPVEGSKPGTGQILGLRGTLNDFPVDYPVYLCRVRASQ